MVGVTITVFLFLLSYAFHLLYKKYDEAFVKEVLNTFLVKAKTSKDDSSGSKNVSSDETTISLA
jgi:hypothetical protein